MFLIASLPVFLGFYLLYITSSRTVVPALPFRALAACRPGVIKLTGLMVLLSALFLLIVSQGTASGILLFIVELSVIASFTSLFLPFLKLRK